MPSCDFGGKDCTCRDCREMNDIRHNLIEISDDEEPIYIFGYCERIKRNDKKYHVFDKNEDIPLCNLTSIYKVSINFKPTKNLICKKCLKHMK